MRKFLLLGSLLFCSISFGQSLETMPFSCVESDKIKRMYATIYGNDNFNSYDCTVNGRTWTVKLEHLAYIMNESVTFKNGRTSLKVLDFNMGQFNLAYEAPRWQNKFSPYDYKVNGQSLSYRVLFYSHFTQGERTGSLWRLFLGGPTTQKTAPDVNFSSWTSEREFLLGFIRDCFSTAERSYSCRDSSYREFSDKLLPTIVSRGLTANVPKPPSNPSVPSEPDNPSNPDNPIIPAFPNDNQSNCSIIDIPCNLRWLFVPSPNYLQDALARVNYSANIIPISSVDQISFGMSGLSYAQNLTIDFGAWHESAPQMLDTMLKTIAMLQVILFTWSYLRLPRLVGHRSSESLSSDSPSKDDGGKIK